MKNIKILFTAMLLSVLGFSSCNEELAQPPINLPEGGIGTGTWDDPMTVYQVGLGSVNDKVNDGKTVWVRGYIVGFVDTNVGNVLKAESANFTIPATVNTNILLAADPDERNWENCIPVQLPSGAVRSALNLKDNPGNQGREVCILGISGQKYCSAYGLRSSSDYNWGAEGNEPDPNFILPIGSQKIVDLNFVGNMNGFTFDQGTPGTEGWQTWKLNSTYGLVATGGITGSTANATDAMAVSGEFDFTGYKEVRMNVHQAANFFGNQETFVQMCQVLVRETGAADWTVITLPILPSGSAWTFVDSGYAHLDDFAGKKVEVAFRYTSTTTVSGTWEVDKLTIYGVPGN